jgi:4-amino-4-deoxy-L-arabinose transferase-like glycosyltransferase
MERKVCENLSPEMAVLLIGGGLLLALGLSLAEALPESWPARALASIGLGCFLLAAHAFQRGRLPRWLGTPLHRASRWLRVQPAQLLLLGLAPCLSYIASLAAGDGGRMRMPWIGVGAWLLAIGLVIAGSWPRRDREVEPTLLPWLPGELLVVGTLFLAAVLLRGVRLAENPWVLTGDEASGGLAALEYINGQRDNIFGVDWFSFPSLFFFVQSLSIRLLGQTVEALRVPAALAGALTVVALYWYARGAFGRAVALGASAYLAAFHLHLHFSRVGLNNVWDGLFFTVLSGALWRAWAVNQREAFVLAGLSLGLAQYFYATARAMFILVPVFLLAVGIKDRAALRQRLPGLVGLGVAALVVCLPLGVFYARHPDEFRAPFSRTTILGERLDAEAARTSPAYVLAIQFKNAALGFTSTNLRSWYEPNHPMLLALPAVLFLAGLGLVLSNLKEQQNLWLVLWLLSAVLGGALSNDAPAAQRYVFVAPAVALLVALPVVRSGQWLVASWPAHARWIRGGLALVLLLAIVHDLDFYFADYAANRRFGDNNTETAHAAALYLAAHEGGRRVYFFGGRMGYFTHATIPYLAPRATGQDVYQPVTSTPDWSLSGPTTFIFLPERQHELALVRQRYPGQPTLFRHGRAGALLFVAYEVDDP